MFWALAGGGRLTLPFFGVLLRHSLAFPLPFDASIGLLLLPGFGFGAFGLCLRVARLFFIMGYLLFVFLELVGFLVFGDDLRALVIILGFHFCFCALGFPSGVCLFCVGGDGVIPRSKRSKRSL